MNGLTVIVVAILVLLSKAPLFAFWERDWDVQVLDDPMEAKKQIETTLMQLDAERSSRQWIEAFFKLEMAVSYLETKDGTVETLKPMLKKAFELTNLKNNPEIQIELKRIETYLGVELKSLSFMDAERSLLELVNEAKQANLPLLEARINHDLSRIYFAQGNFSDTLTTLERALEIAKKSSIEPVFLVHTLLQNINIVMNRDPNGKKSTTIPQTLLDSCHKFQWRYFCFSLNYNRASFYINQKDPANLAQVSYHLKETEKYLKKLNLPGEEAFLHYLWLKYFALMKDPEKALESGRRALYLFQEQGIEEFEVFSYLEMATVLKKAKRYSEAIVYNERAKSRLLQKNYQAALKDSYELSYEIYRETAQYKKALEEHEKLFKVWQEDMNSRERVDYNQKASQIGLYAEEAQNKLLNQKIESQRLLQRITAILLVITLLAVALVWNSFRQYRRIQQFIAREERAAELERQEEIIRVESRHRSSLAGAVAHKINNPLNYLSLQIEQVNLSLRSLQSILGVILHDSLTGDGEEHDIARNIMSLLDDIDKTNQGMTASIHRSQKVVAELRAVSGIDGCVIESVALTEIIDLLCERLQEIIAPRDFNRIHIDTSRLDPGFRVGTDRFILKHALEQLILFLLTKMEGPLGLAFTNRQDEFAVSLPQHASVFLSSLQALELSMRSLLRPAALDAKLVLDREQYLFCFLKLAESALVEGEIDDERKAS